MKVVLLSRVENLGEAGDVVEVADGYARNYLFPSGLAAQATSGRAQAATAAKARARQTSEEELAKTEALADTLDGKSVLLRVPLGPQGKLHGAVTAESITLEIQRSLGVRLPAGAVVLPKPIQEPGEQKLTLELPHGLETTVLVVVEGTAEDAGEEKKR